jgi:hypothetical protein
MAVIYLFVFSIGYKKINWNNPVFNGVIITILFWHEFIKDCKFWNSIRFMFQFSNINMFFSHIFVYYIFVLLYFFFLPLCCLFFDVRILITPLLSSYRPNRLLLVKCHSHATVSHMRVRFLSLQVSSSCSTSDTRRVNLVTNEERAGKGLRQVEPV